MPWRPGIHTRAVRIGALALALAWGATAPATAQGLSIFAFGTSQFGGTATVGLGATLRLNPALELVGQRSLEDTPQNLLGARFDLSASDYVGVYAAGRQALDWFGVTRGVRFGFSEGLYALLEGGVAQVPGSRLRPLVGLSIGYAF